MFNIISNMSTAVDSINHTKKSIIHAYKQIHERRQMSCSVGVNEKIRDRSICQENKNYVDDFFFFVKYVFSVT